MISDREAERCLIGCLFIDDACVADVGGIVTPDDFIDPLHRRAFVLAYEACSAGDVPDPILIGAQLGGMEATGKLVAMMEQTPGIEQARQYARAVATKGRQRRLLAACQEAAREIPEIQNEARLREFVAELQERIGNIGDFRQSRDMDRPAAYRATIAEMRQVRQEKKTPGWATGIRAVDSILLGIKPKQLVVIAAGPGVGKTAMAINIALKSAEEGARVYFCSHEMGNEEITRRDMAITTGMGATKLEKGDVSDAELADLEAEGARALHITYNDKPEETVDRLRAVCQKRKRHQGLDVLVVDYLQLMGSSDQRKNKEQQVAEISRGLKRIAMDLDVCVVALSQLNRGVERNEKPSLNNLRDSGAIAQDANVVMLLWSADEKAQQVNFAIAKNRSGRLGEGVLGFDKAVQRLRDLR